MAKCSYTPCNNTATKNYNIVTQLIAGIAVDYPVGNRPSFGVCANHDALANQIFSGGNVLVQV